MLQDKEILNCQIDGVQVKVCPDKQSLGAAASAAVTASLRQAIAYRAEANILLATGASQYEFLAALKEAPDLDWQNITAFHLDEYLGIPESHSASFRRYLSERIFNHVPLRAVHFLQGDSPDPVQEARRYEDL